MIVSNSAASANFIDDSFKDSFGFTLREVAHVVILGSNFDHPFSFYICACPNVVFGSQDKFVVKYPLRFVVQCGGRMQLNNLVVFYR